MRSVQGTNSASTRVTALNGIAAPPALDQSGCSASWIKTAATVHAIPDRPDTDEPNIIPDDGWFKFPNHLAHRLWKIKGTPLKVYLALRRFAQQDRRIFPSVAKLHEMTGMCPRSIRYAFIELEKLDLIDRKFNRGHSTNYLVDDKIPHKRTAAKNCRTPLQPVAAIRRTL